MFRLATSAEAIDVLSEPETVKRTGKVPESLIAQPWCVSDGDSKMIFLFWVLEPGTYEVHIAAPKKDIRHSRRYASLIIKWLFSNGAERLVTNCPEGKISNLARKLGMKEYKRDGREIYFEVLRWELEQR